MIKHNAKIVFVAGARPNFMKVAPIIHAFTRRNHLVKNDELIIDCLLVHTGQHYDVNMSDTFFQELNLPYPHVNLGVGSASHAVQTARIMERFENICLTEKPDWTVVVGDVNSTLACTLVASKLGIKIAHVEAGLRSFDRTMPEEINRVVTDGLADLLFTPSRDANENLMKEGIPQNKIKFVGNIMIDTLVSNLEAARQRKAFERFGLEHGQYALVTLHRPSNVDDKHTLEQIMRKLDIISRSTKIIFPLHPRTKNNLEQFGVYNGSEMSNRLVFCEPLGYLDTISLIDKAQFVITDSGGIQEETTFLKTPCLTLRPNTERPVTISVGTNKLTTIDTLIQDIRNIVHNYNVQKNIPERWDGKTAERIMKILIDQIRINFMKYPLLPDRDLTKTPTFDQDHFGSPNYINVSG